ncbi:DUF4145 domain-containing protein [Mesorhizobium sp. M0478]|uniref:DUF4145 domain-containing protein n=1 Tax=Mesorhizobium sp. M0478 TaxID=2956947 RepID=UPI00333E0593
MKFIPPSRKATAFNCPHCQVLTTQYWYRVGAAEFPDGETPESSHTLVSRLIADRVVISPGGSEHGAVPVHNIHLSKCMECKEVTVWVRDTIAHPSTGPAPLPNPDLSEDIRRDYNEASTILDLSPRGAAALVRLCIQKLCKELGQPGKNINDDIATLVKAGLDSRIQKALDVVRVIGNNAVHPGSFDRDDRATAESLFRLLNLIADKTISEQKHVDEVYATLPPNALAAIEARDRKG